MTAVRRRVTAQAEGWPSPCFIIDLDRVLKNAQRVRKLWHQAFPVGQIAYPYKTNPLGEVGRLLARLGVGAEVCSESDYKLACSDGFSPHALVVNGPAKSGALIRRALAEGATVNLDSEVEVSLALAALHQASASRESPSIGIRYQPWIEGRGFSVFGLPPQAIRNAIARLLQAKHPLRFGLHLHLGLDAPRGDSLARALDEVGRLASYIRQKADITFVNVGSGFWPPVWVPNAVAAERNARRTIHSIRRILARHVDLQRTCIVTEPGQTIVADAGMMIGNVISIKRSGSKGIVVTTCGLNILRNTPNRAFPVVFSRKSIVTERMLVKGPHCYEGDLVATNVAVPKNTCQGDQLVFLHCGAYCVPTAFNWSGHYRQLFVARGNHLVPARDRVGQG